MNIHYIQHVPFEGLGRIQPWARQHGYGVTSTHLYAFEQCPPVNDCMDWLIVMGGPMGVFDEHTYPWLEQEKRFIEAAIKAGKMVLGICLGAQLIADVLGTRVYRNEQKEIGWFPIHFTDEARASRFFDHVPAEVEVFHWHGDTFDLPNNATLIAKSEACAHQGFIYNEQVIALQFHLETTWQSAKQLIQNCQDELVPAPYIQRADTMLSTVDKFSQIHTLMEGLLNRFSGICTPVRG